MKDYIMRKYRDYHSSYEKLRSAVTEVWDAIGAEEQLVLVREMLRGSLCVFLLSREILVYIYTKDVV
jgi:hypothetical protein